MEVHFSLQEPHKTPTEIKQKKPLTAQIFFKKEVAAPSRSLEME